MSEIISENNLIKGVLLGNNERGVFDYESLGNLPTINGNPAAGELTENLATKGEVPGVYVGQSAPTDQNAVIWINPDGEAANYIEAPQQATVGQTIVVKAVDENGKPTEWEATDMTSSGGGGIVEVYKTTTTEDVSRITITKDSDGNAFSYKMMWVYVYIPKVATEVSGAIAMLSIGANENNNVATCNITSSSQLYINATAYPTGLAESFINGDYVSANIKRGYHENSSPYSKVVLRANTYAVADARIPAGTIVKVFGMN